MENFLSSLAFLDAVHDFKDFAHTYKAAIQDSLPGHIFPIKDETTALEFAEQYADEEFSNIGHTPNEMFVNLGGSATTPIAIVCDACFCSGLIHELKKNTIGKVYYVVNREKLLDPGPKMKIKDSGNLFVAQDIDEEAVHYSKYVTPDNNSIHAFHELHSKFDITIGKKDNDFELITRLNNAIIEDGITTKRQNSVPKIKASIARATNPNTIQSCFLRKRSGDWLQVLSCLDTSREYLINGEVKNLIDCNVYFCSSDRVALAFALCCGINCLIRLECVYTAYKAKEIELPMSRQTKDQLFAYFRDVKREETIAIFREGLQEYYKLKSEWEAILLEVEHTSSLDRLKELLLLALHYEQLKRFGNRENIKTIETFVTNPYDEIFSRPIGGTSNRGVIAYYAPLYSTITRRFRHLNPFVTSSKETYFNVFRFENTSFDSSDMIYGCTLFDSLLHKGVPDCFNNKFVVKCMNRVMELTNYDERIVAMYTLYFEARDLNQEQSGGGVRNPTSFPHQLLVDIGNYITYQLLHPTFFYIHIADDSPNCIDHNEFSENMVEILIYKHHIIPDDYLEYVTLYNEEFEENGEPGPYDEIKAFLKRSGSKVKHTMRRRQTPQSNLKTNVKNTRKKYKNLSKPFLNNNKQQFVSQTKRRIGRQTYNLNVV